MLRLLPALAAEHYTVYLNSPERSLLAAWPREIVHHTRDMPARGCYALGFIGYEHGQSLEPSLKNKLRDLPLPDVAFGLFDWIIELDHIKQTANLKYVEGFDAIKILARLDALEKPTEAQFQFNDKAESNFTPSTYKQAFNRIQQHLLEGDVYQVNLAQRFEAPFNGDAFALFTALQKISPAPFSAFMRLPEACVVSCSPERFIAVKGRTISTKPIKGTRKRGATDEADETLKQALLNSEKDRAENLMIVDLMRNDLGKICEPGSIHVPKLFDVESYPNVHHLVSTVTGKLKADVSAIDALNACFPGGSITGAPKIAAQNIITELEPHARHVYCGSIGYITPEGDMDINIAIRTGVVTEDRFYFWAGGGIVKDSVCEDEYQECLDKVAPFHAVTLI